MNRAAVLVSTMAPVTCILVTNRLRDLFDPQDVAATEQTYVEVARAPDMNNAQVAWFEGNFKEYDADLRRRKGADADTPHRVTYTKLVNS